MKTKEITIENNDLTKSDFRGIRTIKVRECSKLSDVTKSRNHWPHYLTDVIILKDGSLPELMILEGYADTGEPVQITTSKEILIQLLEKL